MSEVRKERKAEIENLDLGDQLSCCQREALVNYTHIPGSTGQED